MLYLKKINYEDAKKEYDAIKEIPENENGVENKYFNCSFGEFKNNIIPTLIDNSMGKNLPEGYVPCTWYFLWEDDYIVGLFKLRHYLNENLKNGAGHVGYSILKAFRKQGYASKGLKLLIDICKDVVVEDEIYFYVQKNNIASLKVQLNNGAKIVRETEEGIYTRIKLR